MHFPNLATIIAQGLSIGAAFFDFKSDFSKITCPSSQVINNRIAKNKSMEFLDFHYRDNNNKIILNYSGHPVKNSILFIFKPKQIESIHRRAVIMKLREVIILLWRWNQNLFSVYIILS